MRQHAAAPFALAIASLTVACGASDRGPAARWAGTVDTLPSGHIVVSNTDDPLWRPGEEWRVVEELRIGRAEGEGPDVFGRIRSFEIDPAGRIWVLDAQAQELRVFGPDGSYVRTVGRKGGGPGEFAQAVKVDIGPDGNVWVMDPQNNRLSIFDTAGTYLEGKPAPGGFLTFPWPGGIDRLGRYYAPVPMRVGDEFRIPIVVYDRSLTPVDTLTRPRDPVQRASFVQRNGSSFISAGVPFQGGLKSQLSPTGTIWAMLTDQYRLFELAPDGDTLRTITRAFTPLPVTAADREQAREDLKWFTDQGGQVDWSKLPDHKPATRSFFIDDEDNIWVEVVTSAADQGHVLDVFDAQGRYLGAVRLTFALTADPRPIIRGGLLYTVTTDELDVPYLVRARIVKPGA